MVKHKRKALAYSKKKITHYTRKSKVKKFAYIKTIPQQIIVKFNMGDMKKFEKGGFNYVMRLVADGNVQIRDLALEACRQNIHRRLEKKFQKNYSLACKVYPHQILRDNKTFSGGSKGERVQTGMKHSFGSAIGRAAYVQKGKDIFVVGFSGKNNVNFVRGILKLIAPKLPCKTKIVLEEKR